MRAADVVEKVTAVQPGLLTPYTALVLVASLAARRRSSAGTSRSAFPAGYVSIGGATCHAGAHAVLGRRQSQSSRSARCMLGRSDGVRTDASSHHVRPLIERLTQRGTPAMSARGGKPSCGDWRQRRLDDQLVTARDGVGRGPGEPTSTPQWSRFVESEIAKGRQRPRSSHRR
jgi:hypothetical protein